MTDFIISNKDSINLLNSKPRLSIENKFIPTDGVGSKLYLVSRVNGTGKHFNIYCIGSVSYCMTTVENGAPNAYVDTKLYCNIDEYFAGTTYSIYPNNIESTDYESRVPTLWRQYPGCHFLCKDTNGCVVKF